MNFGELRTILNYVPQFRGKTFVVAVDGGAIAAANFANLLLDLAVVRSLGIRVVFCFDASPQMSSLAKERNLELSSVGGRGVTDEVTREVAKDACSRLTSDLAAQFAVAGLRSALTQVLTVRRAGIVDGSEQGFRGRVDAVDAAGLREILERDWVPVVSPLGFERSGETLILEAEEVARTVAESLGAAKLIFACERDQMPENPRHFSLEEVEGWLEANPDLLERVQKKLRHARRACENGVARVHLVNGEEDGAILAELFRSEGVGTMVYADVYRQIRAAEAGDLEGMVSMMRHAVEDGQLAGRTEEELRQQLGDFFVLEVDGNLVGCAALHVYPEEKCGEVAALLVRASHGGRGYGRALVKRLEEEARRAGMERLFALSTQAPEFFVQQAGYEESDDVGGLPSHRRESYSESARNSRLFWKELPTKGADAKS